MTAQLAKFPERNLGDIPRILRQVAEDIESGKIPVVHTLAYVMDTGNGSIEIGLAGQAPEAGITAHFLFALAQRKLELL